MTARGCRRPTTAIRGRRSASALILAALIAHGAPAQAQDAPAPPAPEAPQLSPDEQRAADLYTEGDRRYAEGRYEEAIELFKQAYELSPAPLLLFNMANTYERMGAYAAAADALDRYLQSDDADPAEADVLRQRLHQVRKRAQQRARFDDEIAGLRARPETCPVGTPCNPVDTTPRSHKDTIAYVLYASGGAMLVASVVFGAMASSAGDDARAGCSDTGGVTLCSNDAEEAIDRERRFALFTDVSVGAGLTAIGVGTYFYWRYRKDTRVEKARVQVAPTVHRGGIGVSLGGRF